MTSGSNFDSVDGQSAGAFAASVYTSAAVFALQVLLFILLKDRFARIYLPRTYLVPERERTKAADAGWWKWIEPVLTTPNSEFLQKCGLDAYFFLRYMRTLLKIFLPAALIILPILLPLNYVGGKGSNFAEGKFAKESNVTGLDQLTWANVSPYHTERYWAHWLLALALVIWFCYVVFDELRGYIRMRQAYMTSPQHRLRASATTVLVSSIPRKWCSVEALDGLYDVFPGGLRNIWINRNFDELSAKVQRRDQLARKLENAETALIKKCFQQHQKDVAKVEKEAGKMLSKEEKKRKADVQNKIAAQNASGHGLSSGNPHQVKHSVQDALEDGHESDSSSTSELEATEPRGQRKPIIPVPIIGEGIDAVTHGIGKFGRGIIGGLKGVNREVNDTIDTTNGFVAPAQNEAVTRKRSHTQGSSSAPEQILRKPVDSGHPRNEKIFGHHKSPRSPTGQEDDWNRGRANVRFEEEVRPLGQPSPISPNEEVANTSKNHETTPTKLEKVKSLVGLSGSESDPVEYPKAFEEQFEKDDEDAVWRQFIKDQDRETSRLPIFGWDWMISLPFVGQKVDTIYYCRKEVARLNVEIEDDQAHPERFPLMNSAFVQFNHQVAAHMACQSLSHHIPKQMAPRLVEIDPNDVIWDNMSIPWWQIYVRTAIVFSVVTGLIIVWAIPVSFTSALSQLNTVAAQYRWLHWILKIPSELRNFIQGVLPATLLGILMFLLPLILRLLAKVQGLQSGMLVELSVQKYYFFFLFVQLFLIVTIAASVSVIIGYFQDFNGLTNVPQTLAENIPKASNYFFSYMLLQALSVSAGALVQVGSLVGWFILAPLFDSTARAKFNRQTNLSEIQWGTFFPVYTNLACIGLIYSVISPLILVFNIITFTLFWFVYRYNSLYVTKFTRDTGGLLYPNALNTTFTGIYMMEFALIFMFILIRDANSKVACIGQAIGMVIILILTIFFQYLINNAFAPLYRYLPITLEDDAVRRDEEFARAMHKKHIGIIEDELGETNLEDELERRDRQSRDEDREAQKYELQKIEIEKRRRLHQQSEELPELEPYEFQNPEVSMDVDHEHKGLRILKKTAQATANATLKKIPTQVAHSREKRGSSWANRGNRRSQHFGEYSSQSPAGRDDSFSTASKHHHTRKHRTRAKSPTRKALDTLNNLNPLMGNAEDLEAQRAARNQLSDALFQGLNDELEDLSPEQRDVLVQRAFQHSALRARRPVIWLPRDDLGVSDDEITRMSKFSQQIWVSNVRQGLDAKGRCVYSGAPPDFSEVDLIQL